MPANARSNAVLTTESKVTIRGQTTIPAPVREALKLKPGQDSIQQGKKLVAGMDVNIDDEIGDDE